jgi:ribose/xylose/arabinose/galactoside ABC-type transport system permease subunit
MKKTAIRFARDHGSVLIYALLFIAATLAVNSFLTTANLLNVLKQAAVPAVACMGLMLVLTTGGIDLSLANTLGLCSIALGLMAVKYGMPAWQCIPLTLLLGALIGLCNGMIIQYLHVPSFIATLGSGYVLFGIAQIIGKGDAFMPLPADLQAFGTSKPLLPLLSALPESIGAQDLVKRLLNLPSYLYIAVIVVILVYFLRHRTVFGRNLSAFGFNARTARLSGIRVARLNVTTYMLCSLLVALASILLTIRVNCAQSNIGGSSYTFEIVTAAVVGGTSLFGGISSVINCVFGVLITKTLENSINLLKVNYYLYQPAMGVVILLAIILEAFKNRKL